MNSVYIIDAKRLPNGKRGRVYKDVSIIDLAGFLVSGLLESASIQKDEIDGLYLGNVYDALLGQAPDRQVAFKAGLDEKVDTSLFKRVCSSSLLSVDHGYLTIREGRNQLLIAGGMESMSRAPYAFEHFTKEVGDISLEDAQKCYADKEKPQLVNLMIHDGLRDAYDHRLMANLSEQCAEQYRISREELDSYAFESFRRAGLYRACIQKQFILPTPFSNIDFDEGWRAPDWEKMKKLSPLFPEGSGLLTAANSSQYADGASAVVLASSEIFERFRYRNINPMARILAFGVSSTKPSLFSIAPVWAIQEACKNAGIPLHFIDYFEVNEAFSTEPIIVMKELGIHHEKINVWGGAIANGHPLGASGTKILGNLCYVLQERKGRYGIAVACNGGGGAFAALIENCQK